jgi:hypothetical protein
MPTQNKVTGGTNAISAKLILSVRHKASQRAITTSWSGNGLPASSTKSRNSSHPCLIVGTLLSVIAMPIIRASQSALNTIHVLNNPRFQFIDLVQMALLGLHLKKN